MDDNGEKMLGNFMKFQGSSLTEVKELKERGNGFFRQKYFDVAAACYDDACKLLGLVIGSVGSNNDQSLSELAISLNSNLAACALKLEEFQATLDLCSIILKNFPHNVKALYRRTLAFMKLKMFLEAELDLVEALVLEPKYKEDLRELDVVKDQLLMNENGKRVLEGTPIVDVKMKKKLVKVPETLSSFSICESRMMEVPDASRDNHGLKLDKSSEGNESVVIEMKDVQNNCGMDWCSNVKEKEYEPDKSSSLEFSKKGGGHVWLRIAGQSYQKLLEGKKMSFYHKRDLSTITIRILCNEKTEERDKYKKKRRRRCLRKRKMVAENDDLSPLDITNDNPPVPDASSSTSSVCDNFRTNSIQIPNTDISHAPSLPVSSIIDGAISAQPFLFSACSKKSKTYSSTFNKLSSAPRTSTFCRYPLKRYEKLKRRTLISKKNFSEEDESPRHNLSTFSTSRSFSYKLLRPRGVSMSCCRYSSEAKLIRKRKHIFAHLASSDRPLKKPNLIITPTLSLVSFSHNVIIKSDSESRM